MRPVTAWALVAASTVAPLSAQDDPAVSILEQAAARYARVESLCANFVQTLSVPLLGDERTGSGRLCQARPDLFAMRFSDPAGDAIIADGEWVWVYHPSLDDRTVMRGEMAAVDGRYDIHREFLADPASKYDATYQGEDRVGEHPTYRIRLVPKRPASYVAAVVWIDKTSPVLRRIRIEDENESVRTITLAEVELEAQPPGDWFVFTPPPGVQVITR